MSASRKPDDPSDRADDEVTLASSLAQQPPNLPAVAIADDETTSHDTTTQERRRHQVKPLGRDAAEPPGRMRVRTLRSAGAPKSSRARWIWLGVGACVAGGGFVAWRTMAARSTLPSQPAAASATATTAPPAGSTASPLSKLRLDVHVEPANARVQIDGKLIDKTEGVELELPCPKGFHEMRVEAPDHATVVKRVPCEGRVVMDVALEDR